MGESGPQLQGVPAPNPLHSLQIHQSHKLHNNQHTKWYTWTGLILSQNFQENLMRMQKPICFALMTGWPYITLLKVSSRSGGQFKPQIYQGKDRGQNRGNYDRHNYDQGGYHNRYRSDSGYRRQYRQDGGRPKYAQNYRRGNFGGNMRIHQNSERQDSRGEYINNYRNESYDRSSNRNRSRERSFSRHSSSDRNNRSTSNSRSKSGLRASKNRDRIRCYKCKEYDHFTKDYPTSRKGRELGQLHQMLNLDDEETSLRP